MSILLEALKKAEQAQSSLETSEGFDFGNTATLSLSSAAKLKEREVVRPQVLRETEPCELALDIVPARSIEPNDSTPPLLNTAPQYNPQAHEPEAPSIPLTETHTDTIAEERPAASHTGEAPPAVLYHRFVAPHAVSTRWYYMASAVGMVTIIVLLSAYFFLLKSTDGALIDPSAIRHTSGSPAAALKVEAPVVVAENQPQTTPEKSPLAPSPVTSRLTTNTSIEPPVAKESRMGPTPQFVLNESRTTAFTEASFEKSKIASKPNKAIAIVKHQELNRPEFALLQQAYSAYQKADLEKAKKLYQQVHKHNPHQRDALLGLGAIALAQKLPLQARNYYQVLLQLNPKDADAWSGLMALQEQGNGLEDQATIKQMIYQDPSAAALHFSLGNSYAAQGQWLDAQQSYFQAYQREPSNGGYAYNLAVSLDHIDQTSAAVRYYQLALTLAQTQTTHFDRGQVKARLQRLEKKAP